MILCEPSISLLIFCPLDLLVPERNIEDFNNNCVFFLFLFLIISFVPCILKLFC